MTPEQKAREIIDSKLEQSGWIVQDMKQLNLFAGLGVAVREFPTSTGLVDYALFVEGLPVGIIEAKKESHPDTEYILLINKLNDNGEFEEVVQ